MTAWLGQKDTDFIDRSALACTHAASHSLFLSSFVIEEEKQCFVKYAKIRNSKRKRERLAPGRVTCGMKKNLFNFFLPLTVI